eukprot:5554761-Amphidinium_carterae.1
MVEIEGADCTEFKGNLSLFANSLSSLTARAIEDDGSVPDFVPDITPFGAVDSYRNTLFGRLILGAFESGIRVCVESHCGYVKVLAHDVLTTIETDLQQKILLNGLLCAFPVPF